MEYGLGAQPAPAPGTLTFEQARTRILEREHDVHGGRLDNALPD
jgi:hypothetical protein